MKYSIYDIAELSGVSIATVSRVLNNKGYVSKKTEEKVRKVLDELNFIPSEVARGLAKNSTQTLGVYFPSIRLSMFESDYFLELFRGITEAVESTNYDILLINEMIKGNYQSEDFLPKYLSYIKSDKIDGLIVSHKFEEDLYLKRLIKQNSPMVYVGSRFEQGGYNVYGNYVKYNTEVLNYCWKNGHRNIGILDFDALNGDKRLEKVYKNFYKSKNCNINNDNFVDIDNEEMLYPCLKKILKGNTSPTVLYIPDISKVQKVLTILTDMRKRVPEDISIICVEHKKNEADDIFPPITSVYVPAYDMGKASAQLLIQVIENKEIVEKEIVFESLIIERNSVKNINI